MRYAVIHESRHKVRNALALNDPTYENWLRLAETIFTGRTKIDDLQDKEEARKRMQEIDELRARGEKTEYEIFINGNMKNAGQKKKKKWNTELEVTNIDTGEKTHYKSINEFCRVNKSSKTYIRKLFSEAQSNKITYRRLIIRKTEMESLETKIEPHRIYLNQDNNSLYEKAKWSDLERAFIVQNRPAMKYKDISIYLGRNITSCINQFREIKKKDKLDFYKNLDISDKFKL